MKRFAIALGLLFLIPQATPAREVPDLGLMLNDDGDLLFTHVDPEASMRATRASLDALRGTPIKTYVLCIGAGSDILHYDTKVANIYGWRETASTKKFENPRNEEEMWYPRIVKERTAIQKGYDAIRVAGEHARSMGLRFFTSHRMNDDHFMFDPFNYPLTGEFWIKNHEKLIIGKDRSPILSDNHYGNLLDYSHREVREYRLATIKEMIDRYQDIVDGIELDFNRVQVLFPRGTASERAHLVTEMLETVRGYLDDAGRKRDREYYLMVRVPPTMKSCRWAGLEVDKWIERRLVDVVLPSQLMTLAHDLPLEEFVKPAKASGCKVYPSLYPRTSYQWEFPRSADAGAYAMPAKRDVTPALVRGAAQNYWFLGADGFELFNFHHEDMAVRPFSDRLYRILRDLGGPGCLTLADKVFAVTPAYYLDHEDTYEARKQVPATLRDDTPQSFRLLVGEDLSAPLVSDGPKPYVALRLGFAGVADSARLEVKLNGRVPTGPISRKDMVVAAGSHPKGSSSVFAHLRLDDLTIVKQGNNEIILTVTGAGSDGAQLTELQLGVLYHREYLDMLYK